MSQMTIAALILVATFVCFFIPKIPNIAVAIAAGLAFGMSGILDLSAVFNSYTSSTCILMIGMMTVGGAMFQTGLAGWIGNQIIKITGTTTGKVQMSILLITALFAPILTGTATLMILYPLMCSIAISSKVSMSYIVPCNQIGNGLGDFLTVTGTAGIAASASILESSGFKMWGYFEVAWFGIPRAILTCVLAFFFLNRFIVPKDKFVRPDAELFKSDAKIPEKMDLKMTIVLVDLLIALVLFVLEVPGLPIHVVATLAALGVLFTGCITPKQMYKAVSWDVIILIGGMSAFAKGMQASGFGELIAKSILNIVGNNANPILMIFVIMVTTGLIKQFMSDTATCVLMTPIAISIAVMQGVEPYAYAMAALVGSTLAHLTVMSSPSIAFFLQLGGLPNNYLLKYGSMIELPANLIAGMIMIPLIWL